MIRGVRYWSTQEVLGRTFTDDAEVIKETHSGRTKLLILVHIFIRGEKKKVAFGANVRKRRRE